MKTNVSKNNTLLVTANELAEMLSVSARHVWRMKASMKLPRAIEIGNCVRWKLIDISDWLTMGCPETREFENRKRA